jgi:hypothetical protein
MIKMENEEYAFSACPYCGLDVAEHLKESVPLGMETNKSNCALLQKDVIAIIKGRYNDKN